MISPSLLLLILLSSYFLTATATYGFDLSYFQGQVTQSAFNCLNSSGYHFGIIQATAGTGGYNPYLASDVTRAHSAGIKNVDVYIFPDTRQNANSSMKDLVNKMKSEGVLSNNMIWMDVEGTQYWSSSCTSNQNWLSTAIEEIDSLYKGCRLSSCVGIYSSSSQWSPIMCSTTKFSKYQLWYAHYDNKASFSDFVAFGGWTKPAIKQYTGTSSVCGTSIDHDYY